MSGVVVKVDGGKVQWGWCCVDGGECGSSQSRFNRIGKVYGGEVQVSNVDECFFWQNICNVCERGSWNS